MRTATLLGKKLNGSWVMICSPEIPIAVSRQKFLAFRGVPSDVFSLVQYQESDQPAQSQQILSKDVHDRRAKTKADQDKAAEELAAKEEELRKVQRSKVEDERDKAHAAEIDRLNKLIEEHKRQQAEQRLQAEELAQKQEELAAQDWKPLPSVVAAEKASQAAANPATPLASQETPEASQVPKQELRTDGPTLEEYVAAGFDKDTYPPQGFAAKPSGASTTTGADPGTAN